MFREILKSGKKTVFICQLTDMVFKLAKCVSLDGVKKEFSALEAIPATAGDEHLAKDISQLFKRLGYKGEKLVISIPRGSVISRFLKIPSQSPQEIEKIVSLQAPRYFPYPVEELNSAFQVVSSDAQGYSDVNLVIAHKDVVNRLLKLLQGLNPARIFAVSSSYGLAGLFHQLNPQDSASVLLADVNFTQIELVASRQGRVLFSRSFKLERSNPNWTEIFIDEVKRTKDVFLKEVAKEPPDKMFILGASGLSPAALEKIREKTALAAEEFPFMNRVAVSEELARRISEADNAFANLIGLGLMPPAESLNLLPGELKAASRASNRKKEFLRLVVSLAAIIFIFALGLGKNIQNKAEELKLLKAELDKVAQECKPLEEIEDRLQLVRQYSRQETSGARLLAELHKITPQQVVLANLLYDAGSEVVIRGTAQELNAVFDYVKLLQKSSAFKNFNIKVRYATKKVVNAGELVDFEIACIKS